jgi:hypothetical protein
MMMIVMQWDIQSQQTTFDARAHTSRENKQTNKQTQTSLQQSCTGNNKRVKLIMFSVPLGKSRRHSVN